jgi:hypothetical protein
MDTAQVFLDYPGVLIAIAIFHKLRSSASFHQLAIIGQGIWSSGMTSS